MQVSLRTANSNLKKNALAQENGSVSYNWQAVILWSLIGFGIFVRLFHFFDNRSLYIDELFLGASLVKMAAPSIIP